MKNLLTHQLHAICGGTGKPIIQAPAPKECPCRKNRKRAQPQTSSMQELVVII